MLLALGVLGFAGCDKEAEKPDPEPEWEAPLATPWVTIYAGIDPGGFRSDCVIGFDLVDADSGETLDSTQIPAQGREWTGVPTEVARLSTATAEWENCTNTSLGTGDFDSGTFSAEEGNLFLFRYDGVSAIFRTLYQREDYEGGIVSVTFGEGTTEDDAAAIADAHGLTATLVSGTQYEMTWTDTTSVGDVLTALSEENFYQEAQPVWVRQPDWW